MGGHLVLHAGPDLVHVGDRLGRTASPRPRADEEPPVLAAGEVAPVVLEVGEVGQPVVLEDGAHGGLDVLLRQQVAQPELVRPPLADELVAQTARPVLPGALLVVGQVLEEVLSVPALPDEIVPPSLPDGAAPVCEGGIAHPERHLLPRAERRQVVAADERVDPVDRVVVRVPLVVGQDALPELAARVAADQILDRALDMGPVLAQPGVVGVVPRLPVGLEDAARVAVAEGALSAGMRRRRQVGAVVDAAVRPLLPLVIDPAHVPLQLRKDVRQGLLIAPHMRAGGRAAAVGALPPVDVSVRDAEDHADVTDGGELRREAVQQPVWERAVVEGGAEPLGLLPDSRKGARHFTSDRARVRPEGAVVVAHPLPRRAVLVGVVPGQEEGDLDRLARSDRHVGGHGPVVGVPRLRGSGGRLRSKLSALREAAP